MSQSNLSRTALVSADARARPVAQGAAFEAQVPPEVQCEDSSRSPVHHEGGARKATLSLPWRAIDRSQDGGRQSPHSRGAAATLEGVPLRQGQFDQGLAAAGSWQTCSKTWHLIHARSAGRFG